MSAEEEQKPVLIEDVDELIKRVDADDPEVTTVQLSNKPLNEKINDLASALQRNTHVTVVNLDGVDIKDAGAARIALALRANENITTLILRDNSITDEGLRPLCNVLQGHPSVIALDLSFNDITSEGARPLSMLLRNNSVLRELTVSHTQMGNEGARLIAQALQDNPENVLASLALDNNGITELGARALCKLAATSPKLNVLLLNDNRIGDNGGSAFGELLKTTPPLVCLELRNNVIGDDGLCVLAIGVAMNKGDLRKLDVRQNVGTERANRALTGAHQHKPNLDLRWRDTDVDPTFPPQPKDALPSDPAERLRALLSGQSESANLNADEFCAEIDKYSTAIAEWTCPAPDTNPGELPAALQAVLLCMKDIVDYIRSPPAQVQATPGAPQQRFGVRKMRVTDLLTISAAKRLESVDEALIAQSGVPVLLDAFFAYPMNNILHCSVYRLVSAALKDSDVLCQELIKARILDRLVDAEEEARSAKSKFGHVGHIVGFSNALNTAAATIPVLSEAIAASERFQEFVNGPLAELNKRNETQIGGPVPPRVVEEQPQSGALGQLFSALGLFNFMK